MGSDHSKLGRRVKTRMVRAVHAAPNKHEAPPTGQSVESKYSIPTISADDEAAIVIPEAALLIFPLPAPRDGSTK